MVCNDRPGPDWIAGMVMEVLGPVKYIIETEDGLQWKRHADQLKNWLPSISPALSEVIPESLADEAEAPLEDSPNGSVTESEPTVEAGNNEPDPPASTIPPSIAAPVPRYPQ